MSLASPPAGPADRGPSLTRRLRVATAAVAAVLTACGGNSDSASTTDRTPDSSSAVESEPSTTETLPAGTSPDVTSETTSTSSTLPSSRPGTKDVITRVEGVEAVLPEGFSTVSVRVTGADGSVCEVCMWLADAPDERSRGLMGVTDLGDAVGMAFVWAGETSSSFYMAGTPTPLSIAWFASSGDLVSQVDMEPCVDRDPADCESYAAAAVYTMAIEMFGGALDAIGIGPGSTAVVVAGSEAPDCLLTE